MEHSRFASLSAPGVESLSRAGGRPAVAELPPPAVLNGDWRRLAVADASDEYSSREYDTSLWPVVRVPDSFGADPALAFQFNPVWYRRVAVPPAAGREGFHRFVDLEFDAVDYFAGVFVDGRELGRHEGYFAPFSFDVTEALTHGSHIAVKVHTPLEELDPARYLTFHRKRQVKGAFTHHDSRPGGLPGRTTPGWSAELGQSKPTGGITSSVRLRRTGSVRLDEVFITPVDLDGAVHVCALFTNRTRESIDCRLDLQVRPPGAIGDHRLQIACRVPPGRSRLDVDARIPDPVLWWSRSESHLGSPALYSVRALLSVEGIASDGRDTRFGLRTVELERGEESWKVILNGRPLYVRGANYLGFEHLAGLEESDYEPDFSAVTDLGLNALILASHQQAKAFYDLADSHGTLLAQGFSLQWNYESDESVNPGFRDRAARMIAEMAALLWNHPSVAYWYCHNEPSYVWAPDEPPSDRTDYDNRVLDSVLSDRLADTDPIRPVHVASGIGDEHRYEGSAGGGALGDFGRRRSLFVSEFGFFAPSWRTELAGDEGWPPVGDARDQWSGRLGCAGTTATYVGGPEHYATPQDWIYACQRYGAILIKTQIEAMRIWRSEGFGGWFVNSLVDWQGYAGSGLSDSARLPKLAFSWLRAANRPVLALVGASPHPRSPGENVSFPVWVASDRPADTNALVVTWSVHATPDFELITSDPEAICLGGSGVAAPASHTVSLPRGSSLGAELAGGQFYAPASAGSAILAGEIDFAIPGGESPCGYLVMLKWDSPLGESGTNWFHFAAIPPGVILPPGLSPAPRFELRVATSESGARSRVELVRTHRPDEGRAEADTDERGVACFSGLPPDAYTLINPSRGRVLEIELWSDLEVSLD